LKIFTGITPYILD